MSKHVVIGAGSVGSGVSRLLADAGHEVLIVTRSGSSIDHPSVRSAAADASDANRLTELTDGAAAIYNCANPPYHRWATDWPPVSDATIAAAAATGARLVIMSNLYAYPKGSSPMRATDPLDPPSKKGAIRAEMWANALEAHQAGRIEAVEVRASDFFGPGIGEEGHLGSRAVDPALRSKTVRMIGNPELPHSWTYIGDVHNTLFAAGTAEGVTGRPWMAPTLGPMSATEMIRSLCDVAGVKAPAVKQIPRWALKTIGAFSKPLGELIEVAYQFDAPFFVDSSDTTELLGLEPTPLEEQMQAVIAEAQRSATAA